MPGSENVLESNMCMYADDTQLFNRNEESVEQAFKVLVKYEKASGSKINYEKTKGLFIERLRGKLPRFTKISWVTNNIKALGVFHGYNINNDTVCKTIINKMKSYTQIWKTRNLTVKWKTYLFPKWDTKLIDVRLKLTLLYGNVYGTTK